MKGNLCEQVVHVRRVSDIVMAIMLVFKKYSSSCISSENQKWFLWHYSIFNLINVSKVLLCLIYIFIM